MDEWKLCPIHDCYSNDLAICRFLFCYRIDRYFNYSEDIYESAYLDGITGFKKTIYITLPLIKGVLKSSLILVITGTLKVFDLAWTIAPKGIPNGKTYLLGTYQYHIVYDAYRVGYGCAIAVLIVVIGLGISLLVNKFLKEEEL